MTASCERFRRMFIDIENYLRKITNEKTHKPFHELVDVASRCNSIVRLFEQKLRDYSKVRNIISHNNDVIAEFTLQFMQDVERIRDLLVNPPTVETYCGDVLQLDTSERFTRVLELIAENNFSQFPVYDGSEFRGLLTENGLTRWLAFNRSAGAFNMGNATVADILSFDENGGHYQFVGSKLSIPEAAILFFSHTINSTSGRLEALLITDSGLSTDPLLGIITTWDIVNGRSIPLFPRDYVTL